MSENTEKPHHPGSENLKPAQPGEVRNPNGKPKGTLNRKTIFRNLLEAAAVNTIKQRQAMFLGEEIKPETVADQIAAMLVIKALEGDQSAAMAVFDNSFDKLVNKNEITGKDGAPLLTVDDVLNSINPSPGLPIPKAE